MKSELSGGIKNALEKGESLDQIKQTFLNAGYNPEDVEKAIQEINPDQMPNTVSAPVSPKAIENPNPPKIYTPLPTLPQEKAKSHVGIIILIIVCLIILAGAAIAGIFWNSISSFLGI